MGAGDSAGGCEELVLRAVAAGLTVCSNSPEPGVGGLDSVHWDLPRVPAAAVAAAETLFVLPGLRSLSPRWQLLGGSELGAGIPAPLSL